MTNAYLCHSQDANGNDALCTLNPDRKIWTVNSHLFRVESNTILTINQSATGITSSGLRQTDSKPGRYILQITSGPNSGQIRQVINIGRGFASWTMPLSMSVGDTYELMRDGDDSSGAAEDAAFFYSLLGSNK